MSWSVDNLTPAERWGRAQRVMRWGLVCAYMAIIFFLSSLPGSSLPKFKVSDKILHTVEFGGLAFLVCRALRAQMPRAARHFVAALSILATAGYGLTDEFHQLFVLGRMGDLVDVAADSLGASLAAAVWMIGGRHWPWVQ